VKLETSAWIEIQRPPHPIELAIAMRETTYAGHRVQSLVVKFIPAEGLIAIRCTGRGCASDPRRPQRGAMIESSSHAAWTTRAVAPRV
jgi:hypothetical protein